MKMVQFDICNMNLEDKCVVLFEKSLSYLEEIEKEHTLLFNKIEKIIDTNPRYQVPICIGNKQIEVCSEKEIPNVNWDNHVLVITSDYHIEAFNRLKEIFSDCLCGNEPELIYFYASDETSIELDYRAKYKDSHLSNIVLFRSGPHASQYVEGMDFSDNARALFEYCLEAKINEKYELVWLVKDARNFTEQKSKYYHYYYDYKNVSFISYDWATSDNKQERDEYYRVLCLAKVIFMTDAYGFCRNARADQIRVQLWHGCGFKTRTNFVPCENRYEYNIVIGNVYKKIHEEIYGLREDQVVITGYPKADWLYKKISKEKLRELGIIDADKIVFWLPTFRVANDKLKELNEGRPQENSDLDLSITYTGLPLLYSSKQMMHLNSILKENNAAMIIKLHPFQKMEEIQCDDLSNIILLDNEKLVEKDIQINQLLGWADALISDYSSVAIEYMLLDRPIAFTLDDVEAYESSRGFVYDNIREWLPGEELYKAEDFYDFIKNVLVGYDSSMDKRRYLIHKQYSYIDGNSCKRVVERFIKS